MLVAIGAVAYLSVGISTNEDATGYNAQQKFDRVPNTDTCHAVWHTYGAGYYAFWSYYKPPYTTWSSTAIPVGEHGSEITETAYPAVIATPCQGTVVFAYLTGDETHQIKPPGMGGSPVPEGIQAFVAAARFVGGQIKSDAANWLGQSDMWCEPPVLDVTMTGETPPVRGWAGLIEHDDDLVDPNYNCRIIAIDFSADVAAAGEPYMNFPNPPMRFDGVGNAGSVYEFTNLSMEMDGDLGLHCAWMKRDGAIGYGYVDPGFYDERTVEHIHVAYLLPSSYPDARSPQLSVCGDSAHIVYQEAGNAQHIQCTGHLIGEPPEIWTDPERIDTRGDQYLRDQPYRRDGADIWQEENLQGGDQDYEIFDRPYYHFFSRWVSPPDANPALYPNVNSKVVLGYQWPEVRWWSIWHYALWTENDHSNYEVRSDYYQAIPWLPASSAYTYSEEPPVYIGIIGGKEEQPYALRRYGTFRFNDYALDYDPEELLYKVSFLEPPYQYLVRIVVSLPEDARIPDAPSGKTSYTQRVLFDDVDVGQITYAPGMSDTMYALISQEAYAQDRMIRLSIQGLAGSPALLEKLTVYRFETEPAQAQGSSDIEEAVKTLNIGLHPVPSEEGIGIEYSLNNPGMVSIQFFDVSGRKVAEFSETGKAGINRFVWDTPDASSGVYIIRLTTSEGSASTKALLLR